MRKKQQNMVRLIAIILAVLLAGSAIVSALLSFAYAEDALQEPRNQYNITMEYLGEEQALRVTQRLVYTNESSIHLDRVVFYAPANLFRRQSALMYEAEHINAVLPYGYLPAGIDLQSVQVNGTDTDWGFQGTNEIYLRAACDLDSGESCEFTFEYFLLLSANHAFLGISEKEWRLSGFYFSPAYVDEAYGEFILTTPTAFSRWIHTQAADYSVEILLPKSCVLASTGTETSAERDGAVLWQMQAENVRDFSMVFGEYKETTCTTASGIEIRCLGFSNKQAKEILNIAAEAIEACERWFGPFLLKEMDFAQVGYGMGTLNHSGCLWIDEDVLKSGTIAHGIRSAVVQQYFGFSAYARVGADAWLSDSLSEYIAYLLLEESEGEGAYLKALNEKVVPSLQLTIPGGLNLTSDAALLSSSEHSIIILDRGAAVFHELRTAMGREELIAGLRCFYEKGLQADVLTEMDLVNALEESSGRSWEKFLTDWVFNIDEYVNQSIDWLD